MIDFAHFGWRQAIVLLVGLVGVYMVVLLLRLLKVGKSRPPARFAEPHTPDAGHRDTRVDLSQQLPPGAFDPPPPARDLTEPAERREPAATFAASGATGWADPRDAAAGVDFARELKRSSVEAELQQLRRESAALHEEVGRLREELSGLKAARNVSPLYSEAMAMAQSGVTADGIAGQCGISLAEAELLAALARGETDDDAFSIGEETNDGYPISGSRTGTHG